MSPDSKDLLSLVNSHGFAFQLKIENEVKTTEPHHQWSVFRREHPWIDPKNQQEEFIDLVLANDRWRMVVECKRVLDADWVFLMPYDQPDRTWVARLLITSYRPGEPSSSSWEETRLPPISDQSSFCIVRGQGDKDKPMLERYSGLLLRSIEYFAAEELHLLASAPAFYQDITARYYIPVIVTTAKLHVCFFDPSKVDIQNGQIQLDDTKFEQVKYVRFRKTLSAQPSSSEKATTLQNADTENERTVLVIHASDLVGFLTAFHNG